MPRADRTGPAGAGPMTGRRMGFCAGYSWPGCASAGHPRGADWRCRGGRHGWRHQFYESGVWGWMRAGGRPADAPEEREALKALEGRLSEQLDAVRKRIESIEPKDG